MSGLALEAHVATTLVSVTDMVCSIHDPDKSELEDMDETRLVFPYRGVFVRHVGRTEVVADVNHVVFFNAFEDYRISHPVRGGDACLSIALSDAFVEEVVPKDALLKRSLWAIRSQDAYLGAPAQTRLARLRTALQKSHGEPLKVEERAVSLVRSVFRGTETVRRRSAKRQKLVNDVKLLFSSDPGRRWTLTEVGAEIGASPVYLTQTFRDLEGMPLYQYQLRLRLGHALQVLDRSEDLTRLALDLGFSSPSHFSSALRAVYGQAPSTLRRSLKI